MGKGVSTLTDPIILSAVLDDARAQAAATQRFANELSESQAKLDALNSRPTALVFFWGVWVGIALCVVVDGAW